MVRYSLNKNKIRLSAGRKKVLFQRLTKVASDQKRGANYT